MSSRSRFVSGVFLAFLSLMVAGAGVAAATTFTFDNFHPADGATNVAGLPLVSVDVYAPNGGLTTNGLALSVNGTQVQATLSTFQDAGVAGVRVSYQVTTAFAPGEEVWCSITATGVGVTESHDWHFFVENPSSAPLIVGLTPPNGATQVPAGATISAEVLGQVDDVDPGSITLSVNGTSVTPVVVALQTFAPGPASYAVSYTSPAPFQAGSTVQVALGACSVQNECAQATWHFTIETTNTSTAPSITSLTPADGASGVSPSTSMSAVVRANLAPVDPQSIRMTLNGAAVTPTITEVTARGAGSLRSTTTASGYHVIYTPSSPLILGAVYRVMLTACSTQQQCTTVNWEFSVEAPPVASIAISGLAPPNGAIDVSPNVLVSALVTVTGSTLDASSVTMAVNGSSVTPTITANSGTATSYQVSYTSPQGYAEGSEVLVELAACTAGGDCADARWTFTISEPATAPLLFTNLTPADGATGVSSNAIVSARVLSLGPGLDPATFQMSVNGALVTPTVTAVQAPMEYEVSYSTAGGFAAGSVVQAGVSACDLNGDCNGESWSFTVAGGYQDTLAFSHLMPPHGAVDVSPSTVVSAHVVATGATVNLTSITMAVNGLSVTPTVTEVTASTEYQVSYTPPSGFPAGMQVSVDMAACTASGTCATATWSFQVGTPGVGGVVFQNEHPASGATGVAVDTSLSVELLDQGFGVTASAIRMTVNGSAVSATVTSPANNTYFVSYTPSAPFAAGSTVQAGVSVCKNGTCEDHSWSFTTASLPEIRNLVPAPGDYEATLDQGASFEVVDDSGIDPSTVTLSVGGYPVTTFTLTAITNGYAVSYQRTWASGSHYELTAAGCAYDGGCAQATWEFTGAAPPYVVRNLAKEQPLGTNVEFDVKDAGVGVDPQSVWLLVNNTSVSPHVTPLDSQNYHVVYAPPNPWAAGTKIAVETSACDLVNQCTHATYSFWIAAPPYFGNFSPAPNATGVPVSTTISFDVGDNETGVNISTFRMTVDGVDATGTWDFAANPYRFTMDPAQDFTQGQVVQVDLAVCDKAGNCITQSYQFTIEEPAPGPDAPELVYPFDGSWLNYYVENGELLFTWTTVPGIGAYRLQTTLENGHGAQHIDIGQGEYTEVFGLATVTYPVSRQQWDVLSRLDGIKWKVAGLRYVGGPEATPYSDEWLITFAPTNSVTLRSPEDFAVVGSTPPTFEWDPYPTADTYMIALAHQDPNTRSVDQVFTDVVPFFLTEWTPSQHQWDRYANGEWMWTVIGVEPSGRRTNYTLFHFTKANTLSGTRAPFSTPAISRPELQLFEFLERSGFDPMLLRNFEFQAEKLSLK